MKKWQIATAVAALAVTTAGVVGAWPAGPRHTAGATAGSAALAARTVVVPPVTVVSVNDGWRPPGAPDKPLIVPAAPGLPSAPGPVLFSADFNAGSTSGWRASVLPSSEQPGVWLIKDNALEMAGDVNLDTPLDEAYFVAGDQTWGDVTLEANVLPRSGEGTGLVWAVQGDRFYRVQLFYNLPNAAPKAVLELVQGKTVTVLAQAPVSLYPGYTPNIWQTLRVSSVAGRQQVWVNGTPLFDVQNSTLHSGQIGLYAWADSHTRFDNVRVSAAGH